MLRLLPAVVIVGGFFLTLQIAADRADLFAQERSAARQEIYQGFANVSDHEVDRLQAEGDRVDGLIETLFLTNGDEGRVRDTLSSLQAFQRGPSIRAIEYSNAGDRQLILPDGLQPIHPLPIVTSGITMITEGRWSNMLTYRRFNTANPDHSITIILDQVALEADVGSDVMVSIEGLTSALPASSVPAEHTERDHQIYSSLSERSLLGVRDLQLFGQDSRVLTRSSPGSVADYATWSPAQVGYLTATGGLLTVLVASAVYQILRRFDRRAIAKELSEIEHQVTIDRFEASFSHAPVGVVELDADGMIALANPRFASMFGYLSEELESVRLLDLVDQTESLVVGDLIEQILAGADAAQSERRYRDRNGAAIWVRESISFLSATTGASRVLVQIEDISEERRTRVELHRRALFDELTGLPNRANLVEQLAQAIERSQQSGQQLAVMFVDLNEFKSINDNHGHEAGDRMLIEVADRLRHTSRDTDTVARIGGDEFVILCEQITQADGAEVAARRYAKALNRPTTILGVTHEVRASIGLALADPNALDTASVDDLLRRADEAMYQAKSEQDLSFVKYDEAMPTVTINRQTQEAALRAAVSDGELVIHYQPILQLLEGSESKIVGVEALVRWLHPTQGLISPGDFLPLADKLGLLGIIDEWSLETGATQLARWSNPEGDEAVADAGSWFLSVNVSSQLFQDSGFARRVKRVLGSVGLAADRLVLEREESTIYDDHERAHRTMAALRSTGVRVVIDQFGRGATNLAQLFQMDFDGVKLHRSIMTADLRARATSADSGSLPVILAAASTRGIEVFVGGVESPKEAELLRASDVIRVQGFHFSRPMAAGDLRGYVERRTSDTAIVQ